VFTSLDQMLDFATQVIARTGRNASTRVVCDPT
jgi:hypothetical protein